MVLIRKLIIFLMIGFLFCTSCAPETNAETSLPATKPDITLLTTVIEPSSDPETPICVTRTISLAAFGWSNDLE